MDVGMLAAGQMSWRQLLGAEMVAVARRCWQPVSLHSHCHYLDEYCQDCIVDHHKHTHTAITASLWRLPEHLLCRTLFICCSVHNNSNKQKSAQCILGRKLQLFDECTLWRAKSERERGKRGAQSEPAIPQVRSSPSERIKMHFASVNVKIDAKFNLARLAK